MDEKTRLEILNNPVYGPNSPFFWPGTVWHAENFVFYGRPVYYRSTKDFLEDHEYNYSGVEGYIDNTEDPEGEHIEKLYAHFHKLYDGIESWPYHTFVVSALYRMIFHETFPYQSNLYEVTRSFYFDDLNRLYIREGLYDRAISSVSLQSLEETQQDKEIDKVGGRISERTWYHLTRILLDPDSDPLVCQEVIRFIRLLEQYNLIDGYPEGIKEDLLFRLENSFSCDRPVDTKTFPEKYLVCLSLLRISTEKGEQAIKRSLEEKSYGPLIDLLPTDDSSDFPH
jgi:hypothetical protein